MKTVCKIKGVPKDYATMPLGRQLDYRTAIAEFKGTALSTWISQKRTTSAKAIREFVKLYGATEYFAQFNDSANCRDDSIQVFYRGSE